MKSNIKDERVLQLLNKYGFESFIIISIFLFADFMVKIYNNCNKSEYLSTAIIFFIGVIFFGLRVIFSKLPLLKQHSVKYKVFRSIIGTLVLILFDIISKNSYKIIIYHSIIGFLFFYVMLIFFSFIDNKRVTNK